jgi:flagellar FliL protein
MNNVTIDRAVTAVNAAPSPARSKGRLLIRVAVGLMAIAGLAGAAWFVLPRLPLGDRAKPAAVEPTFKATVSLGAVVVNLRGETRRYLRIGVSLGVPTPTDGREIEDHRSQLLDLLIAVLSAAEPETLTTADGKAAIKDTLLARIHDELHLAKVGRIYFTEFVIQ